MIRHDIPKATRLKLLFYCEYTQFKKIKNNNLFLIQVQNKQTQQVKFTIDKIIIILISKVLSFTPFMDLKCLFRNS